MDIIMENREQFEVTKEVRCEAGQVWFLDYYLKTYTSTDSRACYGIKVCKRSSAGFADERETFAITDCEEQANAILQYLASGTVPPSVLQEMVDEWFSSTIWPVGSRKPLDSPSPI